MWHICDKSLDIMNTNRVESIMKEELLKGLTEEQLEKARACKNSVELLEVAKNEGLELTEEQLEAIAGGGCSDSEPKQCAPSPFGKGPTCPRCGSNNVTEEYDSYLSSGIVYHCEQCKHYWEPN